MFTFSTVCPNSDNVAIFQVCHTLILGAFFFYICLWLTSNVCVRGGGVATPFLLFAQKVLPLFPAMEQERNGWSLSHNVLLTLSKYIQSSTGTGQDSIACRHNWGREKEGQKGKLTGREQNWRESGFCLELHHSTAPWHSSRSVKGENLLDQNLWLSRILL